MNIDNIKDAALRERFAAIEIMSEEQLDPLKITPLMRNHLLEGIVLPERQDDCWTWGLSHFAKGEKRRPALWSGGTVALAYRVLFALLHKVPLDRLGHILHKCPQQERGYCVNPAHLKEGTPKENAEDRTHYALLNGRPLGRSVPRPDMMGTKNRKSHFRGPDGIAWIQALRATWDLCEDKTGMIPALARYSGKSRTAVTNVVTRAAYQGVPDDPTKAIPLHLLTIYTPADSAKRRKKWPTGDGHHGTRMPEAAKGVFVSLFHRTRKRHLKAEIIEYCVQRYRLVRSSVQALGYQNPQEFGAPTKEELRSMPPIAGVTVAFLDAQFAAYPPLREEGGAA